MLNFVVPNLLLFKNAKLSTHKQKLPYKVMSHHYMRKGNHSRSVFLDGPSRSPVGINQSLSYQVIHIESTVGSN